MVIVVMGWFGGGKCVDARPGFILVVDDEVEAIQLIDLTLTTFPWPVHGVTTTTEAREFLAGEARATAVLVDLVLHDEPSDAAFELIHEVISEHPTRPCAGISKTLRPDYINRVMALGATYISKFELFNSIPQFVRRAVIADSVSDDPLQSVVYQFSRIYRLSPRETEVVAHVAADFSRDEICERLRFSRSTLKTHAAAILHKSRTSHTVSFSRLDEIGRHLRRAARD